MDLLSSVAWICGHPSCVQCTVCNLDTPWVSPRPLSLVTSAMNLPSFLTSKSMGSVLLWEEEQDTLTNLCIKGHLIRADFPPLILVSAQTFSEPCPFHCSILQLTAPSFQCLYILGWPCLMQGNFEYYVFCLRRKGKRASLSLFFNEVNLFFPWFWNCSRRRCSAILQ